PRSTWTIQIRSVTSTTFPMPAARCGSTTRSPTPSVLAAQTPRCSSSGPICSPMTIGVCIKQVPARDWQPPLNEARVWIRDEDVAYEMNEPDAYALEEALRLKEKHGGEVVACSAGPSRVAQVLREALARGADRAIHVEDNRLADADAAVVADVL